MRRERGRGPVKCFEFFLGWGPARLTVVGRRERQRDSGDMGRKQGKQL